MSKKQDLKDFDRFMDFIKDNPDVKNMILNALNKANISTHRKSNSTNNSNTKESN